MSRVVSDDVSRMSGSSSLRHEGTIGTRRATTRAVSMDTLDNFSLSDDEDVSRSRSRVVSEEQREWETWDQVLTEAIENGNGIIILGCVCLPRFHS